jgi:hypothetical protein
VSTVSRRPTWSDNLTEKRLTGNLPYCGHCAANARMSEDCTFKGCAAPGGAGGMPRTNPRSVAAQVRAPLGVPGGLTGFQA